MFTIKTHHANKENQAAIINPEKLLHDISQTCVHTFEEEEYTLGPWEAGIEERINSIEKGKRKGGISRINSRVDCGVSRVDCGVSRVDKRGGMSRLEKGSTHGLARIDTNLIPTDTRTRKLNYHRHAADHTIIDSHQLTINLNQQCFES